MKKIIIGVFALMTVLVVSAGFALAYGYGRGYGPLADNVGFVSNHETMEDIMENGTYDDLVAYREETGFNIMPWVDSVEDFEKAQEFHEQMETFQKENGYGPGYGSQGRGYGRAGGCPMWG